LEVAAFPNLAARIGSNCTVRDGAPLGSSAEFSYEGAQSVKKSDFDNVRALVRAGKITTVTVPTAARVLDSDWTKDSLKVRLLAGPSLGVERWVHYLLCS
jgi:hypothetical protein